MQGNVSYPYPVLGNGKDIEGTFNVSLEGEISRDLVKIKVKFVLENETLQQMVKEGKMKYAVDVKSRATFYRKMFTTTNDEMVIEIASSEVRGLLEMNFSIIATTRIENYKPDGVDEIFDETTIEAGEVVALGGSQRIDLELDFDPTVANASSFIVIKPDYESEIMSVDYESDYVTIKLPKEVYDDYSIIKNTAANTIHASIVLPVLVDALYKIVEQEDDYASYVWSVRLKEICTARKMDLENDDLLEVAQKILSDPVKRSVYSLKEEEMEGEDDA